MPDDLDDFDMEPTRRETDVDIVRPYEPEGKRRLLFPAMLALLAVVAVGLLAVFYLILRNPAASKATPRPALPAPTAAPLATAPPAVQLPPLDDSDGFVRETAGGLSAHPELARWLGRTALVGTLTAVVVNIADGETPRPHLEFLAPKQRFGAARRPARLIVPDPAGFAGYDVFADVIGSVDATAAATAYRTLAPLFEAAYVELGHPEGGFPAALDKAIKALLGVPVLRADVGLVPHAIGFRYADPKLERLTAAQKQFLRIGPRNVRIVQAKLRELAAALAPPAGTPAR
ncbi:MAG TPA: DUF3014 domain-containing protein [Vicinamibacteria bacterium]|nr:DUF3014 domain-containing protein [Vicinamibacteria bacterium]